jgi:hypothetical protein
VYTINDGNIANIASFKFNTAMVLSSCSVAEYERDTKPLLSFTEACVALRAAIPAF